MSRYPYAERYLVALSGGLDSLVLLHALIRLRGAGQLGSVELAAIHIHHGLQPEAEAWVAHCQDLCACWQVSLRVARVDAKPSLGESPEAVARAARYRVFEAEMTPYSLLLTAHHADDQAETLLLRLLRGSGVKGLAAMPVERHCGVGRLLRPLLGFGRADLQRYAEREGLQWVEDPSNAQFHYDRNYLRHQLMPLLSQRWPSALQTLNRTAGLMSESDQLLNEVAAEDLARWQSPDQPDQLPIAPLRALSGPRRNNLLRYWLQALGLSVPHRVHLQRVESELLAANEDREPLVHWPGAELRRYRQQIYAMPPLGHFDSGQELTWWSAQELLFVPGLAEPLRWQQLIEMGLRLAEGQPLTVRFRRGGERLRLAGRGVTKSLKSLLQESAIPPWQRQRLPLLYLQGQLVAVIGLGVAEGFFRKN